MTHDACVTCGEPFLVPAPVPCNCEACWMKRRVPTEGEMARAYFAQLDPSTVSADEYAEAFMAAREVTPKKGFGFPETEVDDE